MSSPRRQYQPCPYCYGRGRLDAFTDCDICEKTGRLLEVHRGPVKVVLVDADELAPPGRYFHMKTSTFVCTDHDDGDEDDSRYRARLRAGAFRAARDGLRGGDA